MLYPQQSLARNKLDLSGIWDFKIDPDQIGEQKCWQNGLENARPIAVPGSWNEQYDDIFNYLGLAWYIKSTYIPKGWRGQRVFLRIGSACYFATVYINGIKIGTHEGGHLPFAFEITNQIRWDEENIIAISVENELKPTRVPAGNMTNPIFPVTNFPQTNFDFFPFAGIHRPVVLYSVPQIFIEDLKVITEIDGADGRVTVTSWLNKAVTLMGFVLLKDDEITVTRKLVFIDGMAEAQITVQNAKFWSDQNPYLYDLSIQTELDHYNLKVGIRTIAVKGSQVLLNGNPVQLNGFGRHEDFIASGKGLNFPLLVKDYQLMCWTGANSYRTSHYPYSEEEMQLADREGFLIIDEIPAVSLQFEDDANIAIRQRMCIQQIDELITRDKNHPSVVMWSVANEPMTPPLNFTATDNRTEPAVDKVKVFLDKLICRARELDPTRLITFASLGGTPLSWMESCDVACMNRYWGWYVLGGELENAMASLDDELDKAWKTLQKPIIMTEFGADTITGLHGHPNLMWTEEYQAECIRGHLMVANRKHYIAGMQVWNFADFAAVQSIMRVGGLNMKGIFTRIRTPKMAAHVLREFWVK